MENVEQVEEVEPTPEELEALAAKQLLMELKFIKRQIYDSGTLMNGMLIVQLKGVLIALIKKYNDAGMLLGESVKLKLVGQGKHASITFVYTPKLNALVKTITAEHMLPAN